jgi:hypothetical protein
VGRTAGQAYCLSGNGSAVGLLLFIYGPEVDQLLLVALDLCSWSLYKMYTTPTMKRSFWTFFSASVAILVALQANAAVQVSPGPEMEPQKEAPAAVQPKPAGATETPVAFQVGEKFITANSGGVLDMTGTKIGSKQGFTLFDLNGGELADGDEVKIQYIPGKGGGNPDLSKATFWVELPEGIKRKREGDTFKLKQVGTKFAFVTSKGKFVGQPAGGALTLVDKEQDALLVDIIDLSHGKPKRPKAPKTEPSETAAPASTE